jgi:hypothetical protein
VFFGWTKLKTLVIAAPDLVELPNWTFAAGSSSDLVNVDLSGCTSLETLGDGVFALSKKLSTVMLPNSITKIATRAFDSCPLTTFNIPTSLTTIETASIFYGNSATPFPGMTSATIPESVVLSASNSANLFRYYKQLAYVKIESATELANNVFLNCDELQTIDLPANLTGIGADFAKGCPNITTLIVRAITPPTVVSLGNLNNSGLVIKVPATSVAAYQEAAGWSDHSARIEALSE